MLGKGQRGFVKGARDLRWIGLGEAWEMCMWGMEDDLLRRWRSGGGRWMCRGLERGGEGAIAWSFYCI